MADVIGIGVVGISRACIDNIADGDVVDVIGGNDLAINDDGERVFKGLECGTIGREKEGLELFIELDGNSI